MTILDPSDPDLRELESERVPATNKGNRYVIGDVSSKTSGASAKGRQFAGVEVVNGHNFAVTLYGDHKDRRVLAKQTVQWVIPGGADYLAIEATADAIEDDTVIVTPIMRLNGGLSRRRNGLLRGLFG